MKKIYTCGGKIGASQERVFDKRAKELAKSNLSIDDATEKLMKETGRSASHSKMRIYGYRK
jgi:hypothetical protein